MKSPSDPIHPAAATGYAAIADTYSRGRPGYPAELAGWLSDELGLGAGKVVVDLGAGTGKFIPLLLGTGATVIAVEPVAGMLAKLAAQFPMVQARAGAATALLLPDASVDAVVCAQAFHWFATRAALTEIHRVLKPGGRLGLVWNQRDARVDWVARLDAIVNRIEGDAPRYHTGRWRDVFPFAGFGPLRETRYSHGHSGLPDEVIGDRVRSTSFIAALPAKERAKVDSDVAALIAGEPALAGKAVVTMPYDTVAFVTVKGSA